MEAKHTPGPWEVKAYPLRIISFRPVETSADLEEMEANARLIAAAPEMKALLERCAERFVESTPDQRDKMQGDIRALLARIDGGE